MVAVSVGSSLHGTQQKPRRTIVFQQIKHSGFALPGWVDDECLRDFDNLIISEGLTCL